MFGKPAWFKKKRLGMGIKPVSWQGWSYAAGWVAVLILPFLLLAGERLVVESLVWLTASAGALVWDVRQVLAAMSPDDGDVLYIDDSETLSE